MNPQRDNPTPDSDRSWLSAAMDGDGPALERAARGWRDDAGLRRDWRDYHLIGDVLRSGDMARRPARDAAFLQAVRNRLAQEPVVLAPPPAVAATRGTPRWAVPAAVAAGFVVVAGVLVVSRVSAPDGSWRGQTLAGASGPSQTLNVSVPLQQAAARGADGGVIRDPRLDEFLRAHKAAGGGMAVPGSALRRVDNVAPAEAPR